jgi:hypothetical protein
MTLAELSRRLACLLKARTLTTGLPLLVSSCAPAGAALETDHLEVPLSGPVTSRRSGEAERPALPAEVRPTVGQVAFERGGVGGSGLAARAVSRGGSRLGTGWRSAVHFQGRTGELEGSRSGAAGMRRDVSLAQAYQRVTEILGEQPWRSGPIDWALLPEEGGVAARIALGDFLLQLAGGVSFLSGAGGPEFRLVAGFGYVPGDGAAVPSEADDAALGVPERE